MGTLVEKLSNYYDYFLRFSGFPDLSGEVFLNSPNLITQQCFTRAIWIKVFFLVSLKYRDIITVKTVTLYNKLYFFIKSLKSKKKKLALRSIMSVEKYGWAIQKSFFA